MSNILSHMPGQTVTIIQQVFNADGYRSDGYSFAGSGHLGAPVIARVIYPNFTLAPAFPAVMTKLDTGLYSFTFTLPVGATSIGTYIVDGYWYHPNTLKLQQDITQVVVTAPFGVYSTVAVP
jgi:hypothetical protein